MESFDPPNLRKEIMRAAQVLESVFPDLIDVDEENLGLSDSKESITKDFRLSKVTMEGSAQYVSLKIEELLQLAEDFHTSKLERRSVLRTARYTAVYIVPANDRSFYLTHETHETEYFRHSVEISGVQYVVFLSRGCLLFGIKIAVLGEYDIDLYPAHADDYMFVQVDSDKDADPVVVDNLVYAFLYELSRTLDFAFKISSHEYAEPDYPIDDDELHDTFRSTVNFPPSLIGIGMREMLKLYNESVHSDSLTLTILGLVQVFEYAGASISRMQLHREARAMLQLPRSRQPDTDYLDLLISSISATSRSLKSDAGVLEGVILTCCDAASIATVAPPFLQNLSTVTPTSKDDEKRRALKELSSAISATRNQLSHAKPNYVAVGAECPTNELPQFVQCLKLAAEQTIEYYGEIPIELRVT